MYVVKRTTVLSLKDREASNANDDSPIIHYIKSIYSPNFEVYVSFSERCVYGLCIRSFVYYWGDLLKPRDSSAIRGEKAMCYCSI
jgi:hypothetical protein